MITLEQVDFATMAQFAEQYGVALPIEQTEAWARFQRSIPGRTPWRCLAAMRDGEPAAVMSLIDYETHGYHYLRSMHGPVWFSTPDQPTERELVTTLVDYVRAHAKGTVFLRLDLWFEEGTHPVLSTVPYNQTVVIDLTGGDEAILSRMKSRGRRDVRKALRECPAICADETELAMESFDEYYEVMVDTAARDGFAPAPMKDYADMIQLLGPEHCRVFGARIDGRLVAWGLDTVNGRHAIHYYAAMRTDVMRLYVTDKLLYTECCILGSRGVTEFDLMGIGNEFAPSLMGLNMFKTKFTTEVTSIAPSRDVPVNTVFYRLLSLMKTVRGALRHH